MPRSKALITGGAGFIGSHLADRLLADGVDVIALDNLLIGRESNISHLANDPRFTFVRGDVVDRDLVVRLATEHAVDTIFHLAAVHYIPFCNERPYDAVRINVLGTQSVIDAAVAARVRKIVLASTSDVYAIKDLPLSESDSIDPYTVYGTTKFSAERLLRVAAKMHAPLSVSIARLFNVYGPRETNPHVLPDILDQVKAGGAIRLGNLWPRRDFVYVTDVAAAFATLSRIDTPFDAFNVGTGNAYSIGEAVQIIAELTGRRLDIEPDGPRTRAVERACLHANIEKITAATPWRPLNDFRAGMAKWLAIEGIVPHVPLSTT